MYSESKYTSICMYKKYIGNNYNNIAAVHFRKLYLLFYEVHYKLPHKHALNGRV